MPEQGLVSIIIPVYNAEPYLRRCLDSALAQTYPNIEVIAIDDGSPDNCPAICDEYAARDSRVRVIHQKNSGPSAARNVGIEASRGAWLYFVDSDDWCEPEIIEHSMAKIVEHGVNMLIFDHSVKGFGKMYSGIIKAGLPEGVHTGYETLFALYNERLDFGVWHYIFGRHLFDHVRFPVGEICEDITVLHEIVGLTDTVYVLHENGYHHIATKGSITNNLHYRTCGWEAHQTTRMINYARIHHPELVLSAEKRAAKRAFWCAKGACRNNSPEELEKIRRFIKGHKLSPAGLTRKNKIGWISLIISPKLLMAEMKAHNKLQKGLQSLKKKADNKSASQ